MGEVWRATDTLLNRYVVLNPYEFRSRTLTSRSVM